MLYLYKILGFDTAVDESSLKKRYRELAKAYHPDVNKTPGAEAHFKQISSAYEQIKKLSFPQAPAKQQSKAKEPRVPARQTIYRILDSKLSEHSIEFPESVISEKTRIFFMIDSNEFAVFFENETQLPTTIEVRTRSKLHKIKISARLAQR